MNPNRAAELMLDLSNAFGRKTSQSELATWYKSVFSYMDNETAEATISKVLNEDGARFPTIPHFLAVSKSVRVAIGSGGRRIEIEPGVWVDYTSWQLAEEREKREWAATPFTDEQRERNLKRLAEIQARFPSARKVKR